MNTAGGGLGCLEILNWYTYMHIYRRLHGGVWCCIRVRCPRKGGPGNAPYFVIVNMPSPRIHNVKTELVMSEALILMSMRPNTLTTL